MSDYLVILRVRDRQGGLSEAEVAGIIDRALDRGGLALELVRPADAGLIEGTEAGPLERRLRAVEDEGR